MQIEECTTEEKFKDFLRNLDVEVEEVLFQKLVEKALEFGCRSNIFGGGGSGGPYSKYGGFSWSGSNTPAIKYVRGLSLPSRHAMPACVVKIKQAFGV